jgi:uncharacterized Zn-binding protein involved in type VI secretion
MTTIAEGSALTTVDGQPVALHGLAAPAAARWSARFLTAVLTSEVRS